MLGCTCAYVVEPAGGGVWQGGVHTQRAPRTREPIRQGLQTIKQLQQHKYIFIHSICSRSCSCSSRCRKSTNRSRFEIAPKLATIKITFVNIRSTVIQPNSCDFCLELTYFLLTLQFQQFIPHTVYNAHQEHKYHLGFIYLTKQCWLLQDYNYDILAR